ncbi:MAG: biotin/lipoate--protein ligase family protein [Alphaproteobacteria bacterium]
MIQPPRVPPAYRLVALAPDAEVKSKARQMAAEGAEDGTLLWRARDDMLDCAVILHPDEVFERAMLVTYVAMLGLNDAFSIVVQPMTEVTLTWPNRVDANGAGVARIGVELPGDATAGSVPKWMVLLAHVNVAPPTAGGAKIDLKVTSLAEEGCQDLTAGALLEIFARYFLNWVNRWQDDGFDPVRTMWLRHAPGHGEKIELELAGERISGTFDGIDDDGALVLGGEGDGRPIALHAALSAIGWRDGVETP